MGKRRVGRGGGNGARDNTVQRGTGKKRREYFKKPSQKGEMKEEESCGRIFEDKNDAETRRDRGAQFKAAR